MFVRAGPIRRVAARTAYGEVSQALGAGFHLPIYDLGAAHIARHTNLIIEKIVRMSLNRTLVRLGGHARCADLKRGVKHVHTIGLTHFIPLLDLMYHPAAEFMMGKAAVEERIGNNVSESKPLGTTRRGKRHVSADAGDVRLQFFTMLPIVRAPRPWVHDCDDLPTRALDTRAGVHEVAAAVGNQRLVHDSNPTQLLAKSLDSGVTAFPMRVRDARDGVEAVHVREAKATLRR